MNQIATQYESTIGRITNGYAHKPETNAPTEPLVHWHSVAGLMLRSRFLDELEERELTPQGKVKYQFSARGHELGQVILSQWLDHPHDAAFVYYRNRPLVLGLGMTLTEALIGGMVRAGGPSGGRDVGVVMYMPARQKASVIPISADIGSQFSPAAGWAEAIQYRANTLKQPAAQGAITVVFGGDGSTASNGFWSGLNIATTLRLPMLFVIEDNGYAISVKSHTQTPGGNIAQNLASFANLSIWDGDGTDPASTPHLIHKALTHVRQGLGPALLRLTMPRLSGHSSVDNQAYKSKTELEAEWQRDPIARLHQFLVPKLWREDEWQALEAEAKHDLAAAHAAAEAEPLPDKHTVTRHVFAEPNSPPQMGGLAAEHISLPSGNNTPKINDPRRLNLIDAIRRTLDFEMAVNERLLVFGEDVGYKGGVHAATVGLQQKYGIERVFDTALNEEGIIGRAVGMALHGLMPVPEIQFRKYADACHEHIMNLGSMRWRSDGKFGVPMVIRMPGGFRKIGDPWHSVNNEVAYAHAIGLKVAFPSNAEDAVGLLRSALRGNDPAIFFEHRYCYDAAWARRPYPGDEFMLPFGVGKKLATGDRMTVVTWGAMTEFCENGLKEVDPSGNAIDLIDLRTIMPWDKEMVLESVRKTGKCLIVHEDSEFCGFGAEISATLAHEAFFDLDAPIERVASPSTLVPFSQELMSAVVPTPERIVAAMRHLLHA